MQILRMLFPLKCDECGQIIKGERFQGLGPGSICEVCNKRLEEERERRYEEANRKKAQQVIDCVNRDFPPEEIDEILTHIEGFITNLDRPNGNTRTARTTIPPEGWYRVGPATSYAFLLVARPDHQGARPYINRAQDRLTQNIERLYVMGAKEQEPFARYVISEIAKLPNYQLVEIFNVNKDYRGSQGGVGALFVISQTARQNEDGEVT